MSNDGSKLDKSTLGLEFLEQEVDGARVVMVAKPEVVVDKIREMQKEFNNQLLSVMNRIKNLSKCGSCKKEKQVYSVKRTNCTEQSVKSHGKGRHLLPECSNWAAISKVKSYRRIGSPSHVSWVQGASPTHPKKTQSFARRWIDYPKDEANNTCGAALEVLAQCDDCENTGYREEVERKYCSEHTTILGSKPNWSARINFMSPCLCSRSPGWSILCSLVNTIVRRPGRGEPIAS